MKALSFVVNFIKSFVLVMLLASSLNAFWPFGGGENSSGGFFSSGNGDSADSPIELIVNGDARDNDSPTKYYSFFSTVDQNITSHITDHDVSSQSCTSSHTVCDYEVRGKCYRSHEECDSYESTHDKDLTLTLYNLASDGSCDTSTELGHKTQDGEFDWTFSSDGGKSYCLKVEGNGDYDINLTGNAALEAGIADASKKESESPMEFIVALTKAATSDVTISYTFSDGTAVNGTNYTGTNGSVTITEGQQTATISVPLTDTNMTTTKTFSVDINSSNVTVNSDSSSATGSIIGSGSVDADDPNYNGPDICYDSRETSGFCMFGSCMFYQERTNVRAMVNGLDDIDIKKALTRGIAFMDFGSEIGTDDDSRTLDPNDDQAEKRSFASADFHGYYNASMFPNGADYRIGNGADETDGGSLNKDDTSSYYDKSMFKFGLFTQYTTLVTYTKGGQTYQEVLQACDPDTHGSLDEKPTLNDCGIFLGALNSNTKINFTTTTDQTIYFQDNLHTPLVDGTTGYCSQISGTCPAYGTGLGSMSLPTFRQSQVSTTVNIPYSMVIAEQHVGELVTTTDTHTESSESNRTVVFEAPYSSSYEGRVMFIKSITDHDSHADKYYYVFKEGDYWIDSWDINKSKTVVIETAGNVRFFINHNFSAETSSSSEIKIGYHPETTSACNDPHFYMYIGGNFTLDAAGSAHIKNGYIYAKGTLDIKGDGAFASYYSAITADGVVSVSTVGAGSYSLGDSSGVCTDSSNSDLFDECRAESITSYLTGPFDAWDTFRDNATQPPSDRNISTKVAGKAFKLSLASLNDTNDGYDVKPGVGEMSVAIYADTTAPVSNVITFDATTTSHVTQSEELSVTSAVKDARVGFKICATYEVDASDNKLKYILHQSSDCSGSVHECDATTSGSPTWHLCFASDNLAIRPDRFDITPKTAPIKAETTSLFNVTASQNGTGASNDYNVSQSDYSFNTSVTKYMPDDSVNNSLDGTASIPSFSFTNGSSSDLNISYNNVGKINVQVKDIHWADVDADDTPASCDDNGTTDGRYICGDTNATFIPSHFTIENVKLYNDDNSTFTYLSNDLNMSAHIGLTIKAKGDLNTTLTNFDSSSWENPVDINFSISTASTPTINKHQVASAMLGFTNGSLSIPYTETGSKALLFNFQRAVNSALNPFIVQGSEVTLNASSTYTSATIVNTTATVEQNATMIYGRTHATKQRYENDTNQIAPIYFEAYCYGSGCDKTLLPNGTSSTRTNDLRWYVNTLHDTSKHGVVGSLNEEMGDGVVINGITSATPSVATLTYDTSKGYGHPYRTTMENTASSWLIYNEDDSSATKNSFDVEFEGGDSGWSGKHETDVITKDHNITKKTNRRSMW